MSLETMNKINKCLSDYENFLLECLNDYEDCLNECIKDIEDELEHNPTQFDAGIMQGLYTALINFKAMKGDIVNGKESSD